MNPGCPVYIVDDDSKLRQYLVRMLRGHGFEPTPYSTGQDFLDALDFLPPGIALLELHIPDIDGTVVLDALFSRRLDVPLIVMTASSDIPTAVRVIKKGALDFLEKPFTDPQLLNVLGHALPYLDRSVEIQQQNERTQAHLDSLTKGELTIMRALGTKRTNREVADQLHLSVRTIEMHRAHILKKFGVRTFAEVIQFVSDLNSNKL